MSERSVFFVSDGTGITAEAFGQAIFAQFDVATKPTRLPFVDSVEKAQTVAQQINQAATLSGLRPIVFTTVVNPEVLRVLRDDSGALFLDMLSTFIAPLEQELGVKALHRVGRFSDVSQSVAYQNRMEAINYSLAHDDGQSHKELTQSEVILVGVSRSGKTPTSLYLAMQHGIKVSNYPLIPEDFARQQLPPILLPHLHRVFGLSIAPERLAQIRNERRPNSEYASLDNCRWETAQAEAMMRRHGIGWLSTTTKSIEEIATTILEQLKNPKNNS